MDNAKRAALAVREWTDRLDRAEAELASGVAIASDSLGARRMAQAIERGRAVLATLGRGEEAIRAELTGVRPDGSGQALERWAHGESALPRRGRPRRAEWRDVAPTQALMAARQARDALLRLGVWAVLGDAITAARGQGVEPRMTSLIEAHRASTEPVPPGIAPTLAYAGSTDAKNFFNGHLRGVLERIAQRRAGADPAQGRALPAMDGTAALAQRWSHAWSNAACAVYADWLQRRGDGSLESARRSLWQFNDREAPVRFRPADGLTVIPTKGFRLHVDLWLQPVLAQVLAYDASRWDAEPLDGRWHPVRLAIHDLTARDVGDSAEGSRTLYRGLSVEMLYQAVFIDRVSALLARPAEQRAAAPSTIPAGAAAAVPAVFATQDATRDAVKRHLDGGSALRRRGDDQLAVPLKREPPAADGDHDAPVEQVPPARLDWHAATPGDALGADPTLVPLGHVDLWGAIGDAAAWLDFAAIARLPDGWVELPVDLVDAPGTRTRTWLALQAAPAGVDLALLRRRLGEPRRCTWMCRRDGLGIFLTLGVDLRG